MQFLLTLLFLMLSLVSFCQQDSLFISNKQAIKGEITEIIGDTIVILGEDKVFYRIDKSDVRGVVFSDAENAYQFEFSELAKRNNLFSLDVLLPVIHTELALYYERFFLAGYISMRTSFNYNFNYDAYISNIDRHYSVGLDILYYPTAQGKYKYFCGPGIELGAYDHIYYSDPQTMTMELNRKDFYFIYFNNGVLYQITKQLNIGFSFGFGVRNNSNTYDDEQLHNYYNFKTNLGYRF